MAVDKAEIQNCMRQDRKKSRKWYLISGGIVIALFLLSLCFKTSEPAFISPAETAKNLFTAFRLFWSRLFHTSYSLNEAELLAALPTYQISLTRLARTIVFSISGMGTALAGAIFQTVYHNPMASPNIIGATAGVQFGNVLMVYFYGAAVTFMPFMRYRICYAMTIVVVVGVLLLGRLSGGKRASYSVLEMVMAGSIVSQTLQVVTMYMMYNLEDDDLLVYQQLTMGTVVQTDRLSMSLFLILLAASLVPMVLIRYRFNAAAFSADEAQMQGIRGNVLRGIGQVCGVVMMTAAIIHCGDMGMISMAIPHLVRRMVGADFRQVSVISMFWGASLLMGCRIISSLIYIGGTELPVNFIISVCIMPIFFIAVAKQRKVFEV